jgi:glycosyltransferase involved in cell wall biosynthesis
VSAADESSDPQARVAVVIPCFNDGEFVADAVHSIREAEPVEVVVVDDASTDERTKEVIERLHAEGWKVIRHQRNRGVSAARMTGVEATSAPYVFPLDADDLAVPGALSMMADRLDADPDVDVCFGDYLEFGQHVLVRAVPDTLDPYRVTFTNEYPASSLFRRTALEATGGWRFRDAHDDWDLWMGLAERGSLGVHLGPGLLTYRHRVHPGRRGAHLRANHREFYGRLKEQHPDLFSRVAENRRRSELGLLRKFLYPIIYGGRTRLAVERYPKALLDRLGLWTLTRRVPSAQLEQLLTSIGVAEPDSPALSTPGSGSNGAVPRVAVVIPCFDDSGLVADAARSVNEDEPVELVVVDDGSTDPETLRVLEQLEVEGVRVIRLGENRGVSAARMAGLEATSAPYVFPLDADDLAVPGALAMMADRLDARPDVDVCFGDYLEFGDHVIVRAVPEELDPYRVAFTNEYPASSLFRRTALERAGGWQLRHSHEDWDLWMAFAESGTAAVHLGPGLVTYRHRLHPGRRRDSLRASHRTAYKELRQRHPELFGRIGEHRQASEMPASRKRLYPVIYGARPRWSGEPKVKAALDRIGVWTLRR